MSRRSDHSRQEIRDMALAAARGIVSESGYSNLSARKIAAAIGYTVGTLYLVFENLDDLILQVNGQTLDRLHGQMLEDRARYQDARDRLLQLGHTYIRFADDDPNCWAMIFEHRFPVGHETPDWFQDKVARMFGLVEADLEPLAKHHSRKEISQAARALWGGVHGICILAVTDKLGVAGVNSVQELAQTLMSHFISGFIAQ